MVKHVYVNTKKIVDCNQFIMHKKNWRQLNMFKKFSLALMSSVAVLLMANGFAGITAEPCDEKPDVCCKEPAPGPFAFSYAKELSLSCPKDFYFEAQYLLMQPKEAGLEFSTIQKDTTNNNGYSLSDGEIQDFSTGASKWNWNSGLRLAFGGYLGHDVWGIEGQYTYLRINDDHGVNATGKVQLPFWINNATGNEYFHNISERWTGNVHVFDLMMMKPYHVSRYVALNPEFGVRGSWIEEDLLVRHSLISNDPVSYDMNGKNNFWGIGIRAKLASEWMLDSHFSIFSHAAGSMLFSHFDMSQTADTRANAGDYEFKHDFYTNTVNAELALGLGYGVFFNNKKDHLSIKIAYEFHEWFNHNRFRQFTDGLYPSFNKEVGGNLSYNGLSFQMAFNF